MVKFLTFIFLSCDTASGRLTVVKKSKTGAYVPPELPLTVFLTRLGKSATSAENSVLITFFRRKPSCRMLGSYI
jgi:hypothetical protein